jgi:hypothetical protein
VLVLVVSFLPLTGPGTAAVTRIALGCMHVAVAVVLLPALWRSSLRASVAVQSAAGACCAEVPEVASDAGRSTIS